MEKYFSGRELYGDDFDESAIAKWYREEEYAYFNINTADGSYKYEWHGFNRAHGWSVIAKRTFKRCLVLGCAMGLDVAPIAQQVEAFIAVEPAERWWQDEISGTSARYVKPTVLGDLELPDASVDLAVSLGVLHHIPNVSHILAEVSRVLTCGGYYILREPISTMGDWRRPRGNLTKNERGLPPRWLEAKLKSLGFRVVRRRYCLFSGLLRFGQVFGVLDLNQPLVVNADHVLCRLFTWNLHYHRNSLLKKIAPTSVFYVLEKQ